jgi:ankyrin repeat protein
VKQLLAHGADVNKQTHASDYPLFIASTKGYTEIAAQLQQHGAVDLGTWMHMTAADAANELRDFEVAKELKLGAQGRGQTQQDEILVALSPM